jgi:hydrogenase nickel incorporation protein HypA/HybF
MHELPVMEQVLKVVLKHAASNGVSRVLGVQIEVGVMSDLEEEWMQRYFDHLSRGSVAEGARLKVERVPARMTCAACGSTFNPDMTSQKRLVCPECESPNCRLISGQEYRVVNLEAV